MGFKTILRKKTKKIKVGNIFIGGDFPVTVQSMTNTKTKSVNETVKQIKTLEIAGCEIIRCAVPDVESAKALEKIKKNIGIPLVADIHFDYRLAILSMEAGVDKIRINPGTIEDKSKVKEIIKKAKSKKIPIRIGLNSGSLPKKYLNKNNKSKALVEGSLEMIEYFESLNFKDIVLSVKSSYIQETIDAYRGLSKKTDYPIHLGLTEAGTLISGIVKSTLTVGELLKEGIGDTIRISLTAEPVKEITAGIEILKAVGLKSSPELISCPVCARCEIKLESLVKAVEERIAGIKTPIKIAVMGCVVNGPGEAKDADIGIAGGKKSAILFKKGKQIKKIKEKDIVSTLIEEINKMVKNKKKEIVKN